MSIKRSTFFVLFTVALLLSGCNSNPSKPKSTQQESKLVPITVSEYISRVTDERPFPERKAHTKSVGGKTVTFLGEESFTNSPLHQIARSTSTWLERNSEHSLTVKSLFIHYEDEVSSKVVIDYHASKHYYPGQPWSNPLADRFFADYQKVEGYNVVVRLVAKADGKIYDIQHVQEPVENISQSELVAAAIDFTAYKLSRKLLAK